MRKVIVRDYNSEWNTLYQKEERLLIETPGDVVKKIHHIGSTLVKGLSAKLIIEILTSVKRILKLIAPLKSVDRKFASEKIVSVKSLLLNLASSRLEYAKLHPSIILSLNSLFFRFKLEKSEYSVAHGKNVSEPR